MKRRIEHHEEFWKINGSDSRWTHSARNILNWLDRELPLEQTLDNLLEAGCENAAFTPHLARRAHHLRACDPSPSLIAANCRKQPDVSFFVQDLGTPLAAEPSTFNAVWCSGTLAKQLHPAYAVNEFHRVLKPGGKLLITVPYHGFLKNIGIALFRWNSYFAPDTPYIRFFTVKTLTQLVKKAGFRNIRTEPISGPVPSQILLAAKK